MRASRLAAAALALCACDPGGDRMDAPATLADSGIAAARPTTEVVQLDLSEWSVRLSADTIPTGAVTFQISNAGEVPHTVTIEGQGETWNVDEVLPGEDATLRVELAPGIYDVYCPLQSAQGSHDSLGVRTRLVVTDAD